VRRLSRAFLYVGTVGIVIGLGRIHAQFIGHYVFHSSQRLPWSLAFAGLLCLAAYGVGLPDLDHRKSAWAPAVTASIGGGIGISLIQLGLGSLLLPRFVILCAALLVVPWFAACARLADVGRNRDAERDRIVLVARSEEEAALKAEMSSELERPAALVGVLSPADARSESPTSKPLIEGVLAHRGSVVVLDRAAALDETIVGQAATLHEAGLRVRSLSVFYDEWLGKLPVSELERMSLMFDVGELHRLEFGRIKRVCDIAVGAVGLVALTVVIPVVAIGDLVANRGPLLYRQPRVGKAGKRFAILKFRTMQPGTEVTEWTVEGDRRITPFGRLLRRTHFDELPQVINILRGDQSVVGPRPEQPSYVAELRQKIPFYDLRHLVRPGLTGWAQVKYSYGCTEMDALEKLQFDFYYLRHQSLGLDVRIIGRTLRSVLGRGGQ
jgi:lipopolysaccharide/colanic/teichoic acid biosynthesis glycosyltransferase